MQWDSFINLVGHQIILKKEKIMLELVADRYENGTQY